MMLPSLYHGLAGHVVPSAHPLRSETFTADGAPTQLSGNWVLVATQELDMERWTSQGVDSSSIHLGLIWIDYV